MIRVPLLTAFICCMVLLSYSQDSLKKTVPATKPVVKYKPALPRAVPAKPIAHAAQPVVAVRKDTAHPALAVPADKSLNGQYQFLLARVYRYQQPQIAELWRNVMDTLNTDKHKLNSALNKAAIQNKTIDSLNAQLSNENHSLDATKAKVDSVDLLGIAVSKSAYNMITWGLVLIFGITAVFVIVRSGSYSREAKYRVSLYNELEEEFKTYKAKANEKEKKLARELQTERNKLDELMGRG